MKRLVIALFLTTSLFTYSQDVDNSGMGLAPNITSKGGTLAGYPIINVIPSPVPSAGDITYQGGFLWVGGSDQNGEIHKVSPVDGTVITSLFPSMEHVGGLTFANGSLWAAEGQGSVAKEIYEIDPTNGQTLSTISHNLGNFTHGMEFFNDKIYVIMFYSGTIDTAYIMDTDGTISGQFALPNHFNHGIAHDGCNFWVTSNETGPANPQIHEVDDVTFAFSNPDTVPGGFFPNGIAWDGQYIWVANNESDSLYQIDISSCVNSVKEEKISFDVSVYPNPATNVLVVESNQLRIQKIVILDLSGSEVKTVTSGFHEIGINELKSGVYFLQIHGDTQTVIRKFAKQ